MGAEHQGCNLDPAPFVPRAVNAAGETALDVARRLKHTECEELVGGTGEILGLAWRWGAPRTCPPCAESSLTCLIPQLEQAQAGKLSLQIHVDYDWEPPQEFPYDSEDELEEKVPAR